MKIVLAPKQIDCAYPFSDCLEKTKLLSNFFVFIRFYDECYKVHLARCIYMGAYVNGLPFQAQ